MMDAVRSEWRGRERLDFVLDGKECILVRPDNPRAGRPWVWRAEFFDAFAQVDEAMLDAGYHIAYVRLSDRYGCPSAVEDMARFCTALVGEFDLKPKAILFGFSRGGLYAANFAFAHPEMTDKLYLDAPVMDIRSWPGGMGEAERFDKEWAECMECYGLDQDSAAKYTDGPLFRAAELAGLNIPVVLVSGDADRAAVLNENGYPFALDFARAGGRLLYIVKPGAGHHPHSLEDPAPVVAFLTEGD